MEEKNKTFHYTYSARQQEEIRNIRKKYAAVEDNKMEQLRKLDRQVTQKAQVLALILGVMGALVMGSGMSLAMTDIGAVIGLKNALIAGIAVGMIGMIPMVLAYPLYNHILQKERQRIAPEILRLTDELMK